MDKRNIGRREFIAKCGTGLAGIIAAGQAPAALVKSLIGAKETGTSNSDTSWENPYVTDGLVAMWDGEWNVGPFEHSDEAEIWKDLAGENDIVVTSKMGINDRYVHFQKERVNPEIYLDVKDTCHVEAVVRDPIGASYYTSIVGLPGASIKTGNPSYPKSLTVQKLIWFPSVQYWRLYGATLYAGSGGYWTSILEDGINFLSLGGEAYVSGRAETIYLMCNGVYYPFKTSTGLQNGVSTIGQVFIGSGDLTCDYYCIRIYNRKLTETEIMHNYAIDKERFEK